MNNIIIAIIALVVGILLADIEALNTFFIERDLTILTNTNYILPVFFSLMLFVVKNIYDIAQYTDEIIPLQLAVLSLVLAVVGFFVFFRILLLGTLILIAAAYWNHGIFKSYFPFGKIE